MDRGAWQATVHGVTQSRTQLKQEVKESAWNAGDPGLIPGSGRSPGEGNGNPLQYSCLEATVHGVPRSRTQLSDFTNAVCRFFADGHSDLCEVISHCSFDFHFSNN